MHSCNWCCKNIYICVFYWKNKVDTKANSQKNFWIQSPKWILFFLTNRFGFLLVFVSSIPQDLRASSSSCCMIKEGFVVVVELGVTLTWLLFVFVLICLPYLFFLTITYLLQQYCWFLNHSLSSLSVLLIQILVFTVTCTFF